MVRLTPKEEAMLAGAEGEALVRDDNFSARVDVNRRTGRFSRPSHALYGVSLVGVDPPAGLVTILMALQD